MGYEGIHDKFSDEAMKVLTMIHLLQDARANTCKDVIKFREPPPPSASRRMLAADVTAVDSDVLDLSDGVRGEVPFMSKRTKKEMAAIVAKARAAVRKQVAKLRAGV